MQEWLSSTLSKVLLVVLVIVVPKGSIRKLLKLRLPIDVHELDREMEQQWRVYKTTVGHISGFYEGTLEMIRRFEMTSKRPTEDMQCGNFANKTRMLLNTYSSIYNSRTLD